MIEADRKQTAIHEAGHAVVARVLGVAAGEVTIRPTEDQSIGHSIIADPRFIWQRGDGSKSKAAKSFAVALFAGAEAERLILQSQDVGDGIDRERATACLAWAGAVRGASFVGDDVFERHEERLRGRAAQLVQQHRLKIERVADALIERQTLSGAEVDALLNP